MGSTLKTDVRRDIRDAGLRATAPRVAVLQLLRASERPLSHSEVVRELGSDDWDRATLFRNLVKLEESSLARIASRVGGVTRYEASNPTEEPHLHPHFACRECGAVTCMSDTALTLPQDPEWREALQDADLQLVGRCPGCRRGSRRRRLRKKGVAR